jgi:uncharacterized protein (UPF0332 family)
MIHSNEIQANIDRSNSSLQAAKLLKDAGLLDDSASRAYYSVFHAASALLLSRNLTFNSHAGILRAINLQFVKTGELDRSFGREINWLAELRQVSDYGEIRHVEIDDVTRSIEQAEAFLTQVTVMLNHPPDLQSLAAKASRSDYDAILANVLDVPPEPYDRLPTE